MTQVGKIEIVDLSQEFFREWDSNKPFTINNLERYYAKFADVFDDYFKSHCQRSPERLNGAIERYQDKYETMKRAATLLPTILKDVYDQLSEIMGFQMNLRTRILVGGFGSNAYVTHDGTLHFAIESITDEPKYLRVLVGHEMAHAFHFEMLRREGFDFSKLEWDGYTSLYLEGVATFVSELLNPDLPERVYFSFDDTNEDWIVFFKKSYIEILTSLKNDLQEWTMEEEREWFRLRGGKKYGFNRLGYLIGKDFISYSVKEFGLKETITFWAKNDIKSVFTEWFKQVS